MVNGSLFLKQGRLETVFYCMVAFALLGPSLGIPITEDFNFTFFRCAFLLLALGMIWRWVTQKGLDTSYLQPIQWHAAFFALWFLYGIFSITWAVSVGAAIRYLIFLAMMLLLTLSIPYFLTSEDKFWRIQRLLLGVYGFIVYFAVFESITWIHLPSSRVAHSAYPSDTITSVFTNQNDLATCITLALPFLVAALFMLPLKRNIKWFLYGTAVFSIYVLIGTGSRINTVLVIPAIALLFIGLTPFVIEREKITKRNVMIAIAATLTGVLLAILMSATLIQVKKSVYDPRTKILSSIDAISDLKTGAMAKDTNDKKVVRGKTGESVTVRYHLLINGMKFLKQSHYMGVGAGNIEPLMEKAPKVNKKNIHNWWAEVLVNFGVIVFIFYMALYVWLLWRLWNLARLKTSPHVTPITRWAAFSCLIALVGYFGGGVAPSTAIHYTPMWITYGMALAVLIIGEMQKGKVANH
ncbi:O-antigen ligase family protein [Thermoflavimicrobium dichotomicum]|uniref:O-Antigen ligase n=1 Tax=Thermoflavimicrobium dichotomicum TaxID=46223 RepID=A0A1I3JZB7_9BACL|nr:O-antigen ligase family protein [Thermoflavimicrobium dichotomicum]SFI65572.1 O-Antigen ligase [Thermoflavimicrobium dichotomicum]